MKQFATDNILSTSCTYIHLRNKKYMLIRRMCGLGPHEKGGHSDRRIVEILSSKTFEKITSTEEVVIFHGDRYHIFMQR